MDGARSHGEEQQQSTCQSHFEFPSYCEGEAGRATACICLSGVEPSVQSMCSGRSTPSTPRHSRIQLDVIGSLS